MRGFGEKWRGLELAKVGTRWAGPIWLVRPSLIEFFPKKTPTRANGRPSGINPLIS
jgi:hypothetical protein